MMNDRAVRGKQQKPTLKMLSIRIDRDTYDYFDRYMNRSNAIREVLDNYVKQERVNYELRFKKE
jgi:metal-responsive CopG/Arc/MetJ family transcriptional regulator